MQSFSAKIPHKPVRRVVRRGHSTNVGWFPSIKMGRLIAYESPLERLFLTIAEADPSITGVLEQPEKLRWKDGDTWRTHVPDFLIIQDGEDKLREIKSSSDAVAFEARTAWIKSDQSRIGRSYEVLSEDTILAEPALYNAKLLVNARRCVPPPSLCNAIIHSTRSAKAALTIQNIVEQYHGAGVNLNSIYALILTGYLELCKKDEPLSSSASIKLRRQ